jgi:NADH-quinone oxidoreductase subunit E
MSTANPVKPSTLLATDRSMLYSFHEQDKEAILRSIGHYDDSRAASIDALKIVQNRHGWVPDEAIAAIGSILGIPTADIEGVATLNNI